MIFLNDIEAMTDPNVRKAAAHAIDKQLIVDRLLSGYGVPDRHAADARLRRVRRHDRGPLRSGEGQGAAGRVRLRSGQSVRFTIQSTRGFKPKDYEMVQAIRRPVAPRRHRGRDRGLRDRQALRAARRRSTGAGGLLQLGQLGRRSDDLDGVRDVRPLAALGLGRQGDLRSHRAPCGAKPTRRSASRAGRRSTAGSPRTPR